MTVPSDVAGRPPSDAYVWVWLPDATEPVVAGRIRDSGQLVNREPVYEFIYGETYLANPAAVSLYAPELPLGRDWIEPPDTLNMAGCLWDASPDSWGQHVIDLRLASRQSAGTPVPATTRLTYLLESGSDRIGALDFQASPEVYVPRDEHASLDELHAAAQAVQEGRPLSEVLSTALVSGTAVGGARPKVLVREGDAQWIAKLSTSVDHYPVVQAEALAMWLARSVGLNVPRVLLTTSLGRDVLLVERFDRPGNGRRTMMVSALTLLGQNTMIGARYASYPELVGVLARHGSDEHVARELFERVVFNIAVGNTDDHARNHSAFWDGSQLTLTPAYDICPQRRTETYSEASQAMDVASEGQRASKFALCVEAAPRYGLSAQRARDIIDAQITGIRDNWEQAADEARLARADRDLLWGRAVLNRYALENY